MGNAATKLLRLYIQLGRRLIAVVALACGMTGATTAPVAAQVNDGNDTITVEQDGMDASVGKVTGLPLPRFVSLKKSRANARVGPGPNYPVKWVYLRQGLPVEITAEHDNWRRIRDRDGDEAWVHHALVDGRRTGIVEGEQVTLWRKEGNGKNDVLAYLDPGVVVRIKKCGETQCRIEVGEVRGWIPRAALWGLYPDETID